MDDVMNQPPPVPQRPGLQVEAQSTEVRDVPVGSDGRPRPEPAAVPPPAPTAELPAQPAPANPQSEFKPEWADKSVDKLVERFGDDAINYLKDKVGVSRIEADLARAKAQAKYGLTDEQAAAIPGKTAEDIQRAAEFAASLRTPATSEPSAPVAEQPPAQPTGAPLPKVEREPPVDPAKMTDEQIFDPAKLPPDWLP